MAAAAWLQLIQWLRVGPRREDALNMAAFPPSQSEGSLNIARRHPIYPGTGCIDAVPSASPPPATQSSGQHHEGRVK